MRSKLALILALAAFLALAAVGSAPAASPLGSVSESLLPGADGSGTSTTPSTTTTPSIPSTTTTPAPQCADGIDNDGDGLIDMEDPDCASPTDTTEGPESAATAPTIGETLAPSTSTSGSGLG